MGAPTRVLPRRALLSALAGLTMVSALVLVESPSTDERVDPAATSDQAAGAVADPERRPATADGHGPGAGHERAQPSSPPEHLGGPGDAGSTRPAPAPATPSVPDEVARHEADLVVRLTEPLDSRTAASSGIEGAGHVAAVGELAATTSGPDGDEHELQLLAVEPATFRPLTPEVTAQQPSVWQRLAEGDVLVRHDVAHDLQLELGGQLELTGEHGSTTVRIGALAANGAPPFAEAIVPDAVARELGATDITTLLVAAADGEQSESLAQRLADLGEVETRRAPEPEQAPRRPTGSRVELEPFTYTSRGDGTIAIHGDWAARNIVTVDIPRMGTTRCHRAMVPQLYAALQEIIDEGLYDHLRPEQFGGCWVPRHILWNPNRALSMHAWGLAIDFNVQDNWYGDEPQMDPRIVEIFEKWGFAWGGYWSTPDGMHFEVDRLVESGGEQPG